MLGSETLEEDLVRGLLDAAPVALLLVDGGAHIVFANARCEAMFGHARAELLGRHFSVLVPAEGWPIDPGPLPAGFIRGGIDDRPLMGRKKSGRGVPRRGAASTACAGARESPAGGRGARHERPAAHRGSAAQVRVELPGALRSGPGGRVHRRRRRALHGREHRRLPDARIRAGGGRRPDNLRHPRRERTRRGSSTRARARSRAAGSRCGSGTCGARTASSCRSR